MAIAGMHRELLRPSCVRFVGFWILHMPRQQHLWLLYDHWPVPHLLPTRRAELRVSLRAG